MSEKGEGTAAHERRLEFVRSMGHPPEAFRPGVVTAWEHGFTAASGASYGWEQGFAAGRETVLGAALTAASVRPDESRATQVDEAPAAPTAESVGPSAPAVAAAGAPPPPAPAGNVHVVHLPDLVGGSLGPGSAPAMPPVTPSSAGPPDALYEELRANVDSLAAWRGRRRMGVSRTFTVADVLGYMRNALHAKGVRKRDALRYLQQLDQERVVRSGKTRLGRKVWALEGSFAPRT